MAEGQRTTERTGTDEHPPHEDHGHSIAAWALVGIVFLGSLVSAFAMVLNKPWLFWVGVAVAVVGVVVGKVLKSMGFGATVYEQGTSDPKQAQGVK